MRCLFSRPIFFYHAVWQSANCQLELLLHEDALNVPPQESPMYLRKPTEAESCFILPLSAGMVTVGRAAKSTIIHVSFPSVNPFIFLLCSYPILQLTRFVHTIFSDVSDPRALPELRRNQKGGERLYDLVEGEGKGAQKNKDHHAKRGGNQDHHGRRLEGAMIYPLTFRILILRLFFVFLFAVCLPMFIDFFGARVPQQFPTNRCPLAGSER